PLEILARQKARTDEQHTDRMECFAVEAGEFLKEFGQELTERRIEWRDLLTAGRAERAANRGRAVRTRRRRLNRDRQLQPELPREIGKALREEIESPRL